MKATEKMAEALRLFVGENRTHTEDERIAAAREAIAAYTAEQAQDGGPSAVLLAEWLRDPDRAPAAEAFHVPANRHAAQWIEWALIELGAAEQAQAREVEGLTEAERDSIAQRVVRYPFLSPMDIVDEVERTLAARWGLKIKEQV